MRPTSYRAVILVILLLCSALFTATPALGAFADISENWAKDAIISLEEQGLFQDLWEENFEPHNVISHETSLQLIAKAFELQPEAEKNLATRLQAAFAADSAGITRGEFASLLADVIGLENQQSTPGGWYPSFVDVEADYPGYLAIELLHKLRLLPSHMLVRFEPFRLITRSEAAYLIHGAQQFEQIEGIVAKVDGETQTVQIQTSTEQKALQFSENTLLLTPRGILENVAAHMEEGQKVTVLLTGKKALLVTTEQETTTQALLQSLNNATKILADVLTPEQVSAIIAGDWEQLSEEVQYELYNELVARGAAPWEADALLKQDWPNLQTMLQDRLTQEAASYLQVTPELVHSAITGNWPKLLEYAQVELAQRLLTSDWLQGIGKD